ncbi:MAG: glycosyl transferase family 2 [Flavobacterium sp. MedPE-SWcel]|uniref:glycosyltransferase family 2 protein n=1 Tax=uncultured Flavobacterium sp. TaxID=165435 RepID=UPI00091D849A|nr:glycosyltransferase family 2 protein [uncultured Flavobacterium sp.]OIQ17272.1 MAG: glycosyl transferase family 2 [Flavobacterium sp. MedPE-SWcel]
MYDIAVILINYNSSKYTINCIKSVIEHTSTALNYQIIITDNCSQKEDYNILKKECDTLNLKNLTLVRNTINTGFGGGNMIGIQHSNAKYYAFLNNDTLLKNDCLSILKSAIEKNPEIGIAGAQAYNREDNFMVSLDHYASPAREIFGRSFLEKINTKRYPKRKRTYNEPVKVNFIPGSFMFVKAEDFNKVGGFDTNIFLYYEETDLCKRLNHYNKYAYLIPDAEFLHYHGASTERSITIKKELKISLLYIMRKHYGLAGYSVVLFYLIIKYFFSSIVKPKNWSLFFLILKGGSLTASLKQQQKISSE